MTLTDITHRITVDDIESVRGYDAEDDCSIYVRPLFELRSDHYGWTEDTCPFCTGCSNHHTGDQMRWKPGDRIIRFTSSGLEVT